MRPRRKKLRSVHRTALGKEEDAVLQGIIRVLVKDAQAWMRRANAKAHMSTKKPLVKNVIAPDGFIPNSTIRQDVHAYQYRAFIEVKRKGHTIAKVDVSRRDPLLICMDRTGSVEKEESKRVRKEQLEVLRAEAARFKLSAIYNESKKILRLLEQTPEELETESHLLRYQNKTRRLLQPSLSMRSYRKLDRDEFLAMRDKLVGTLDSQENAYDLIAGALKAPPDDAAVEKLITILGSQVQLHQYLVTFKQSKHLLPYLIHRLGGSDRAFRLIDKALMGDLWSIYRIAKCMALDLKTTVRLLTSIEMTVAAATSCLVTRACHFHHVEDFVNMLLRQEWTATDLIELANGRYVQNLKPGEKPNRNPLLTVATRMSENAFLGFYNALHELNYRYFKSLGSVQYEQLSRKTAKTANESQSQYAEILGRMEDGKDHALLRPSNTVYRKLASQMLEISTGGGLPPFLAEYFAQMVEKQLIIVCSEVLLEACSGRSAIESLSLDMNLFLEAFLDTCFHIKRIIRGRLSEAEVTRILISIVKGDGDEVYRLEGLLEPSLAQFLINVLRTKHGKVVRGILIYTLISSSSEELDSLLQKCLEINGQSAAKPLIEIWITLADLIFLLAEDLRVDESINSMLDVLRQTKFFIDAGCKGVITIPSAPSYSDRKKHLVRSFHMPIKARASSMSVSSKSSAKSILNKDQREMAALKSDPSRKLSTRDYRFMLTRVLHVPPTRSDSEESLQQDFLDGESEFFSAQRGAINMDLKSDSESNIDTDDSFVSSSIFGAFNRGKLKVSETESQIEMLKRQIKIANHETPMQNFIEPEQMELVEDSWRALVELQGIQKVMGSKDWDEKVVTALSKDLYCALLKLTSWLRVMIGDQRMEMLKNSYSEALHGNIRDGVDLTKILWQELSTLKSSGVVNSVEETYIKFKEYLNYLRAELSDEVQFLNEVDAEALHYGINDLNLLETGGLERSDESSGKLKTPTHIVPSLRTMLSKKEIMIVPPTQPEQAATPSTKSGKPSSGEKKTTRPFPKDFSVEGKAYHVQALPELSVSSVSKKSVTLIPPSSPAISTQKAESGSEDTKVETHLDGILKEVFLPKRKSVHYVLYEAKKDELAKYLQTRHDYNKESSEKIANHLFKAGITGISHNRLSHLLSKLLQEKTAGKGAVSSDEISNSIHRNLRQGMSELIDWVELLDSVSDISAGSEVTTSPSSETSPKSHTTLWSASASLEPRTKSTLPPLRSELKPSVESIKSKASTRLLKMIKKTSSTPTSLSSSNLTTSEMSKRSSPLSDAVATTDSWESVSCEARLPALPGPHLGETSSSKSTTSPYGTWAYTVSTETPSSEFTDRVLTDENADLESRRPFKAVSRVSVATVSPFEVAEHIANVLEAIIGTGEESSVLIRGTLNVLAEGPPDLDYLEKLINKYHEEKSIFLNDGDNDRKLMNVFKDVIFETASMMLRHLDTEKAERLLGETKEIASAMFSKLSQVGTIILSKNDVQRLFDGISVLNSNSFLEGDLFRHRGTPGAPLPRNAQRWFKPLDLHRIFHPSLTVKAKPDSSGGDKTRLPAIGRLAERKASIRSDVSAVLLADSELFGCQTSTSPSCGRTGLASFRFGNSTLCHRGERGALGSLIRADATAELSHQMVVNYDLAHVFNRYSLFQLTELFGGT
ncbi:hypothetical protein TcWFU_009322 [Taenia crassiceps]|uniref:Uncharacterized protein n=1 Tax=Taenia crassiceps TaxID=6207 RepID=A0ABR4QIQ5_9CEST